MGMSYNTGTANAIIADEINFIQQKKECKFITKIEGGVAKTSTIATVPTGKVWRIISFYLTLRAEGINVDSKIQINGTTALLWVLASSTSNATAINLSYENAIVLEAGTVLSIYVGSGMASCGLFYIEEDA